jgi:PAS domain S-box-containing protein
VAEEKEIRAGARRREHADALRRARENEAAHRRSEERLRFALEISHTGAWDLDLADLSSSRSLEHDRIFGYREPLPQWTYEMFLKHVIPEDRPEVDAKFRRAIAAKSDWNFECRIRRVDDGIRWIWAAGRHLADSGEKSGCMAGIVQDITERKHTEEELRKHVAELAVANSDLDSFSYSVAHDLRNPLNNIIAMTSILRGCCKDSINREGVMCLDYIEKNVSRMSNVISDLLHLSHISLRNLQLEQVDLGAVASKIAAELRQGDPQRAVEVVVHGEMIARADLHLMELAMENLMNNAWKYSKGVSPSRIEVGAATQDCGMAFFVRDNGIGFDMKDAERIFLPFQRAHAEDRYEGSGIGLSIVKHVIEKHGGRIWVESEIGKGACFYFTLPR